MVGSRGWLFGARGVEVRKRTDRKKDHDRLANLLFGCIICLASAVAEAKVLLRSKHE